MMQQLEQLQKHEDTTREPEDQDSSSPGPSPAILPIHVPTPIYPFLFKSRLLPDTPIPAHMSLHHLEFQVVHATSWDDNYPPEQLVPKDRQQNVSNGGVRHGKGWQSQRLCAFPQEIILQLTGGPARILKIQVLSHHYKIASKLDIYVGSVQRRKEVVGMANSNIEKKTLSWEQMPKIIDYDNEEEDIKSENKLEEDIDLHLVKMNDEPYVHFRRLGYCALDSNERASFKARELKSIRLDIEGEYIRLVARRCHSNHLNQHNQVGLVGITIMGEPIDDLLDGESQTIPLEHVDNDVSRVSSPETCLVPVIQENSSSSIASLDHQKGDFASLYSILPSPGNDTIPERPIDFLQNNEQTATLISVFSEAKEAAVKAEDFHAAKVYKNSIELVERSVDQIEKLDARKKKAVEEEDFDNAAKFKYEIDAIKTSVQNSIISEGIQLDENGEVTVFDADLADIVGIADHSQPQVPEPSPPIEPVSGKNMPRIQLENFPIDASESAGRDPQKRQHGRINELQADAIAKDEYLRRSPSPLNLAPKSRTSSNASCVNPAVFSSETVSDQEPNTPTKTNPAIWEPYEDERPLPALANVKSSPIISPSAPEDELAEDEPEELSDLARSAFALSVQVFGDRIVAGFMSKKFKCRESALAEVTQRLDVEGACLDIKNVDKVIEGFCIFKKKN
jgi:hypothetical protein